MLGKRLPGKRSNLQLMITSLWTILGLTIIISGHLVIVFFAYGKFTGQDLLTDAAQMLPDGNITWFYISAALAIAIDIWILIEQKRYRDKKIKR